MCWTGGQYDSNADAYPMLNFRLMMIVSTTKLSTSHLASCRNAANMIKVATLSAIVLISLIALESVIGAKGCDTACYSRTGLWTDKCYVDDCDDCHPCNYMIPNKTTNVRSPCPAFNTLANHDVISRDGKCINGTNAVEKFQTYFGCQMETCMLVLTQVAIIQSRCKGWWKNSKYESPFGPRLGFPGDNPFMFIFATSEDFMVK